MAHRIQVGALVFAIAVASGGIAGALAPMFAGDAVALTPTPSATGTATPLPPWIILTPTITPTPTFVPTLQREPFGDANCDLTVNSVDAAVILQTVAGLVDGTPCARKADVDSDGRITSVDAELVLQFTSGLIGRFPPTPTIPLMPTSTPCPPQGCGPTITPSPT
jgi:hypothetical protein